MKIRIEVHCTDMDSEWETLDGCVIECPFEIDRTALEDVVTQFMEQVRAELPVA